MQIVYSVSIKYLGLLFLMLSACDLLIPMFQFCRTTYSGLPPEGILINFLVACILIHAGLAYFIATNNNFKRIEENEEQKYLLEDSAGEAEMAKE
jgi:hypothetical protein